ncbi:reverse transcriptase zinc-binding domain-containing protein [Tanacetum coccineum]
MVKRIQKQHNSKNAILHPSRWKDRLKDLLDVPVPVLDHDRDDMALWFNKHNEEVRFSVKEAWRVLRTDVPKGRLKTQDRISRWFNAVNMLCPFCKKEKDSYSHLFFDCDFAQGVWNRLKVMSKLDDISRVWAQIISDITIRKANNSIWSIIQRLVLGAAVYFIWQERNFRLFRGSIRSAEMVTSMIIDTVRLRLLGLKIKHSCKVLKADVIWNLPWKSILGDGARSTFGSSNSFGIMDISIGMTSSFFRPYACDHPVVITMSDWVGYGSVANGNSIYWVLGNWGSRYFGKGLGSGYVGHGSAIFSHGFDYFRVSTTGFWECNTIYIIDKGCSKLGTDFASSVRISFSSLVQFC